jgi:hypothetical protein
LQGTIQNGVQKVVSKNKPIPQALQEMQEYLQAFGKSGSAPSARQEQDRACSRRARTH